MVKACLHVGGDRKDKTKISPSVRGRSTTAVTKQTDEARQGKQTNELKTGTPAGVRPEDSEQAALLLGLGRPRTRILLLGADNSGEGVVENVLEAPPSEGTALQVLDGLDLVGQLLALFGRDGVLLVLLELLGVGNEHARLTDGAVTDDNAFDL